MELDKDTLPSAAAPATTAQTETQVSSPSVSEPTTPGAQAQPERKFAGKFQSTEELEIAYKNLESKIGQKTYAESVGQRVVESTGYSIKELEEAGYSSEQIAQAVMASQKAEKQELPVAAQETSPLSSIKKTVEDSRVERLEWDIKVRDFFSDNPLAKDFKEELKEFHSMPQYRDMSPEDIFNSKLSKFVKKSEQLVQAKQSEKERASLSNITHNTPPEVNESTQYLERYQKSRHFDDATKFVGAFLRGGRK